MSQRKLRVAVIFGGRSGEHTISCVTAGSVLGHLDAARFDVIPIGITQAGRWVHAERDPSTLRINEGQLPSVAGGTEIVLRTDPTRADLVRLDSGAVGDTLAEVDVVFPLLHGAFGEDGTLQGLLELAELPYVGAGVFASAAAMDKVFAKKLLAACGLPVGDYVALARGRAALTPAEQDRLGLPVFVKPARAGSSVGISKVTSWAELPQAVDDARRTDPKVIVEAAVDGREVECGVLEFPDGSVRASLPAEIKVPTGGENGAGGWYDFEAKYLDDAVELDIPAILDEAVTERLRALAVEAFAALDCQGLARVDFFVGTGGQITINEINTMPGFTATSAYPQMWAVTGLDYATLLSTMIDTALARGTGLR